MPNDDWVFWLNLTNIALGLIVVLAVLVMAYATGLGACEQVQEDPQCGQPGPGTERDDARRICPRLVGSGVRNDHGGWGRANQSHQSLSNPKTKSTTKRETMACPFLKEGRAQYCHAAPARKLILEGPGVSGAGRCASPEYYRCDLFGKDELRQERCPHLEEVHVQYCGATTPDQADTL